MVGHREENDSEDEVIVLKEKQLRASVMCFQFPLLRIFHLLEVAPLSIAPHGQMRCLLLHKESLYSRNASSGRAGRATAERMNFRNRVGAAVEMKSRNAPNEKSLS